MNQQSNKIGISMRMVSSDYGEWRDAISHDMIDFIYTQGFEPVLIPNKPEICTAYIRDAVMLILSGGDDVILRSDNDESSDLRADRDRTEWALLRYAIAEKKPVLGICRGMQFINTYFGGECVEVSSPKQHIAVDHEVQISSELLRLLFQSHEQMTVNSFHRLGLRTLGTDLVSGATATDGEIEAIEHGSLPIVGLMWHPERGCSNPHFADIHEKLLSRFITHHLQS